MQRFRSIHSKISTILMSNRNAFVISVLSISLTACAQINGTGSRQPDEVAPASGSVKPLPNSNKVVNPTPIGASKNGTSVSTKYLGMKIADGQQLGSYTLREFKKINGYKLFEAYVLHGDENDHEQYANTKLVLMTDKSGKVIDSKEVLLNDIALVESKSSCVMNNKPYSGFYVLSDRFELKAPIAVWSVNSSGKLVDQEVKDLLCGTFLKGDGDDGTLDVGYYDLRKDEFGSYPAYQVALNSHTKEETYTEPKSLGVKLFQNGNKFGNYEVEPVGWSLGNTVSRAGIPKEGNYMSGSFKDTKMIFVSDHLQKITDSKEITQDGLDLVSTINGCVVNNKPYAGAFALSYKNALKVPVSVWIVSDNGKLLTVDIKDIKCGVYDKVDVVDGKSYTFQVGYNVWRSSKPKVKKIKATH